MAKKTYKYYKISYSKNRDAFSTWVYVGEKKYPDWDDFGLEIECKCIRGFIEETQKPTDEADYVHFWLITHIKQALKLGYDVSFCDKPEKEGEKNMKYIIQDKLTGTFIDIANSPQEAEQMIRAFEKEDKSDGIYEPDFYEYVEEKE